MFIARVDVTDRNGDDVCLSAKGLTLKSAYDDLKEQVSDTDAEDFDEENIEYFEGEKIQVEIQITKKVVLTSTPKAKPAPPAVAKRK